MSPDETETTVSQRHGSPGSTTPSAHDCYGGGGELIADLLDLSLLLGSSMCAEYIVRAATFEIERSHIQMAIIKRDFRTLAAIVHKSHSLAVTTGEIVASTPHRDIAEWLFFHESRCFSLAALCEAVRHSQLKMLKLLFKLDPFLGEPIDQLHQIASPSIKAAVAEIVREAKSRSMAEWQTDKNACINMNVRAMFYLQQPQQVDAHGNPVAKQDGPAYLRPQQHAQA
ncbi:hypothetical protein HK105_207801 [Polyrhizophydium stewartii]|uniref:Uncharacterized protein n=1 Tax=Polyrhizophydium stewartii TaxID=2732419 RepID=A0ABR4MZP1_9FUNG